MFDPALRKADVAPMPAYAIYAGTAQMPKAEDMKQALPKYEATQIAGTGHFVMMEKPDEFNRLTHSFRREGQGRKRDAGVASRW